MRELSLFSGAGGGLLASKHLLGWRCLGYVEFNDYCQRVIAARIRDGLLDDAPIFGDIRAFVSDGYAAAYSGLVDVVSGGFPCQDISYSNSDGEGIDGARSGLWSSMADIVRIVRPRFVFVENSPALISRGLGRVLGDLAGMGFHARWACVSASDLGAFQRRKRIWIVARAASERLQRGDEGGKTGNGTPTGRSIQALDLHSPWDEAPNPRAFGSGDAVADGMDRITAIGNGQVPIVAATAWRILSGEPR